MATMRCKVSALETLISLEEVEHHERTYNLSTSSSSKTKGIVIPNALHYVCFWSWQLNVNGARYYQDNTQEASGGNHIVS